MHDVMGRINTLLAEAEEASRQPAHTATLLNVIDVLQAVRDQAMRGDLSQRRLAKHGRELQRIVLEDKDLAESRLGQRLLHMSSQLMGD
ncbi:MAG TPA: hypothetical protein VFR15_15835 [Chloroflexia bacterium]|nr:hypothetical protein [Chloroflexia bacterium]